MSDRLPPMTSLRAFEAVARHHSISAAAAELSVSQPAVSQQVRRLEDELGVQLTVRRSRGVELTPEGEVLATRLTDAFGEIRTAVSIAKRVRHSDRSVSVSLLATFAQRWLIHRLGSFKTLYPDVAVRVVAVNTLEELDRADTDVVIRCGERRSTGRRSERLMVNQFFPVASPALIAEQPIETAGDLRNHVLIRVESAPRHRDWPVWLTQAKAAQVEPRGWMATSSSSHAIEAAIAGLGVAIAHTPFVVDSIAAGHLIAPLKPAIDSREGDYFVDSPENAAPQIEAFHRWLVEQARGPSPL